MENSSSDNPADIIVLELTLSEVRALYRVLEFQYIPYDNKVGREIVDRVYRIVRDYEQELARLSSRAT